MFLMFGLIGFFSWEIDKSAQSLELDRWIGMRPQNAAANGSPKIARSRIGEQEVSQAARRSPETKFRAPICMGHFERWTPRRFAAQIRGRLVPADAETPVVAGDDRDGQPVCLIVCQPVCLSAGLSVSRSVVW